MQNYAIYYLYFLKASQKPLKVGGARELQLSCVHSSPDPEKSGPLTSLLFGSHSRSPFLLIVVLWEVKSLTPSTCTISKTSSKAVPTMLSTVSSASSTLSTNNSEKLSEHRTLIWMTHMAFSFPRCCTILLPATNEFELH